MTDSSLLQQLWDAGQVIVRDTGQALRVYEQARALGQEVEMSGRWHQRESDGWRISTRRLAGRGDGRSTSGDGTWTAGA